MTSPAPIPYATPQPPPHRSTTLPAISFACLLIPYLGWMLAGYKHTNPGWAIGTSACLLSPATFIYALFLMVRYQRQPLGLLLSLCCAFAACPATLMFVCFYFCGAPC